MSSPDEKFPPESFDVSLVATIRCAIATAGTIIFALDLPTYSRRPQVSDLVPVLYVTYSVILPMIARWRRPILPDGVEPWLDVSWAVALMALGSEHSGLPCAFALFALIIATFQWGLRLRLRIPLGSALIFACVGTLLSFAHPELELRHIFVGLTALGTLGYMTTAFGGRELIVKGQLAFMKEATRLSNPCFGVDRTISMFMECLRAFHEADACILLDTDLGDIDGLDLLPELLSAAPQARVVILTGIHDPEIHRRSVLHGAMGLVTKNEPAEVLLQAIAKAHAGEVWLDRTMPASVQGEMTRSGKAQPVDPEALKIAALTPCEREVSTLMGQGYRDQRIADCLGVAEITVRNYLTSIFGKLGVTHRLELAMYAYRHGLIHFMT